MLEWERSVPQAKRRDLPVRETGAEHAQRRRSLSLETGVQGVIHLRDLSIDWKNGIAAG
ncbi:hypothetical protein [Sphingomonas sp.]|uniref:hypothetical protein n=1 Tax=Sphingomonas sp. TaxID=28214 RepID=UPI0031DD2DF8